MAESSERAADGAAPMTGVETSAMRGHVGAFAAGAALLVVAAAMLVPHWRAGSFAIAPALAVVAAIAGGALLGFSRARRAALDALERQMASTSRLRRAHDAAQRATRAASAEARATAEAMSRRAPLPRVDESSRDLSRYVATRLRESASAVQSIGATVDDAERQAFATLDRLADARAASATSAQPLAESVSVLGVATHEATARATESAALARATEEIQSFVAHVRKMAKQTKLLALNAAMEAARVGEQGQGFAVVATEVRRLARSSAEAAERADALVLEAHRRAEAVRALDERSRSVLVAAHAAAVDARRALEEVAARLAPADGDRQSFARVRESLATMAARLEPLAADASKLADVCEKAAERERTLARAAEDRGALAGALAAAVTRTLDTDGESPRPASKTPAPVTAPPSPLPSLAAVPRTARQG